MILTLISYTLDEAVGIKVSCHLGRDCVRQAYNSVWFVLKKNFEP